MPFSRFLPWRISIWACAKIIQAFLGKIFVGIEPVSRDFLLGKRSIYSSLKWISQIYILLFSICLFKSTSNCLLNIQHSRLLQQAFSSSENACDNEEIGFRIQLDKLGPVREVLTQTHNDWEEWKLEDLTDNLWRYVERNRYTMERTGNVTTVVEKDIERGS